MADFMNFATSSKGWEYAHPILAVLGEVKANEVSINLKKGIIEGYLTKYNVPGTDTPVIDPYKDIVVPGAFTKTIRDLEQARSLKGYDFLIPHLWQHNPSEIIGGDRWLVEDAKGVIFETQLAKGVRRADEALELISQKMLPGISYGYDAIRAPKIGDYRHLKEVRLHETSSVTFPANEYAGITGVKSFYCFNGVKTQPMAASFESVFGVKQSPMDLNGILASQEPQEAMSDFFGIMDAFGMAVMQHMREDMSSMMPTLLNQLDTALSDWANENCSCLVQPSDNAAPYTDMGYMGLRGLTDLTKAVTTHTPLSPATRAYIETQYTHIKTLIDTQSSTSTAPDSTLFKGWEAIAPRESQGVAPLDEMYTIAQLIANVSTNLKG